MSIHGFAHFVALLTALSSQACGLVTSHVRTKAECRWLDALLANSPNLDSQVCQGHGIENHDLDGALNRNANWKRVALVVRGESYRNGGGQWDRNDCLTSESLRWQEESSLSHVRYIIEPIEACDVGVDVFLGTYKPKASLIDVNAAQSLIDHYTSQRVVATMFVPNEWKGEWNEPGEWDQERMFDESLQMVVNHTQQQKMQYLAVFVIRFDVVLKQNVMNLYRAAWNRILFAWLGDQTISPFRVCDILEWIPWPYFDCVVGAKFHKHESGFDWRQLAGEDSVSFLFPGEHHANTEEYHNDLYRLVRPEANAMILDACQADDTEVEHNGPWPTQWPN